MSVVKQNLLTMVPDMPAMIPNLTEERASVVYDIFLTVKQQKTDRKARALKRRRLLEADKYVRSSGRTHEEIEADLREMRSDRF